MKFFILVVFFFATTISCVQKTESTIDLIMQDGILLLCKISPDDDYWTSKNLTAFSKVITKISKFNTFKSILLKEQDFCITSNIILENLDSDCGTNLMNQNNFLICSISPSGTCDDDNVIQIVIIDYGSDALAKKQCNKIYSFFDNGGTFEIFSDKVTSYNEDGVFVLIEFLFEPDKELLDLFDNVTHYNHEIK